MSKLKIISGGQTGVDQGALDFALDNNFECGGYCPKGRKSEMGIIPYKYPVIEIESEEYIDRTRKNIIESDGTLIIKDSLDLMQGTKETIKFCKRLSKAYLVININTEKIDKLNFDDWLTQNNIKVLNIAGNRESENPGIQGKTYLFLIELFNL